MNIDDNYEPFGEEWEKELMKFTKKQLIQMYKKVCILNLKAGVEHE